MLSRTADHVYWLGRYAERAENLARTLDVQYRLSLLPRRRRARAWAGPARSPRSASARSTRRGSPRTTRRTGSSTSSPSTARTRRASTTACGRRARTRTPCAARSRRRCGRRSTPPGSRPAATRRARFSTRNVAEFIEWVKYRAHLARGVVLGSMLRDEGYHFMQIGTFLERADGVARLLRIRLACEATDNDGEPATHDYLPWTVAAALAVGVRDLPPRLARPRHAEARGRVRRLPSRRAAVAAALGRAGVRQPVRASPTPSRARPQRRAGVLHSMLRFGTLDSLAAGGAESFLQDVIARVGDLNDRIGRDFLGHAVPA